MSDDTKVTAGRHKELLDSRKGAFGFLEARWGNEVVPAKVADALLRALVAGQQYYSITPREIENFRHRWKVPHAMTVSDWLDDISRAAIATATAGKP